MKNYAKIGNRKGKPAYRTPSRFIAKKVLEKNKSSLERTWNLAKRLEYRKTREKRK